MKKRLTLVRLICVFACGVVAAVCAGADNAADVVRTAAAGGPPNSHKDKFRSNSLLIKLTPSGLAMLRDSHSPQDTGIPELDAANREFGVTHFERLVPALAPDDLPQTHAMAAWFEIRIPGPATNEDLDSEADSAAAIDPSFSPFPVMRLRARLARDPDIAAVELNRIMSVDFTPNDPYFSGTYQSSKYGRVSQWGPQAVGAPAAWDVTLGSANVIIAVVDTGVDGNHPDLAGKVVSQKNFVNCQPGPDCFGHGTHVAGIIAAKTNNGIGIAGMCPSCRILSVRVLDAGGSGPTSDVIDGITYAANSGARIINLSLGGPGPSQAMGDAIAYAVAHGALPVIAMGNANSDANTTDPVYWYDALAVVASDQRGDKASFSNFGIRSDVAAPGVAVLSTTPTYASTLTTQYGYLKNYDALSGTSMATPMTAGTAGLVLSLNPGLTPGQLKGIVLASAGDGHSFGTNLGFGVINAARAVAMAATSDNFAPAMGAITPSDGSVVSKSVSILTTPSDDVAVHHVDFIRDGTRVLAPATSVNSPAWSTQFPTTMVWNGLQALTVNTVDTSGNASARSLTYDVRNTYVTRTVTAHLCDPATPTCPNTVWDGASSFTPASRTVIKQHMVWTNSQWLDGYGGALGGAVTETAKIDRVTQTRTYLNGVFPMYWSTNTFDSDLGPILQPGFKVTLGTSLGFLHICFWQGKTPCDPLAGTGETDVTVTFTYPQ
jgi:thermitase